MLQVCYTQRPSISPPDTSPPVDAETWARAHFPHASNAELRENAYTIMESTVWSLGVDVLLRDGKAKRHFGAPF